MKCTLCDKRCKDVFCSECWKFLKRKHQGKTPEEILEKYAREFKRNGHYAKRKKDQ